MALGRKRSYMECCAPYEMMKEMICRNQDLSQLTCSMHEGKKNNAYKTNKKKTSKKKYGKEIKDGDEFCSKRRKCSMTVWYVYSRWLCSLAGQHKVLASDERSSHAVTVERKFTLTLLARCWARHTQSAHTHIYFRRQYAAADICWNIIVKYLMQNAHGMTQKAERENDTAHLGWKKSNRTNISNANEKNYYNSWMAFSLSILFNLINTSS